jgi:hypothetical protein
MNTAIFCDVAPYSLVDHYQRLGDRWFPKATSRMAQTQFQFILFLTFFSALETETIVVKKRAEVYQFVQRHIPGTGTGFS